MSRIAVVMITYNQADYIIEALEGIRLQSRVPDEVVIGDDGSQDNTPHLIRDYVKQYGLEDRWTLLLSSENRGIVANLQAVIDATTADLIVPMAGDDISLPNRCAVTERVFAENPEVPIIITSGSTIDSQGNVTGKIKYKSKLLDDAIKAIRKGNPLVIAVGQSWRREIFSKFGPLPTNVPNEDVQISFRGLISGGILKVDEKTFFYRIHERSESAWLHKNQNDKEFYERFIFDLKTQKQNIINWRLAISYYPDGILFDKIKRKSKIYNFIKYSRKIKLKYKIILIFQNTDILNFKDVIYILFGKTGIILIRKIRKFLR